LKSGTGIELKKIEVFTEQLNNINHVWLYTWAKLFINTFSFNTRLIEFVHS